MGQNDMAARFGVMNSRCLISHDAGQQTGRVRCFKIQICKFSVSDLSRYRRADSAPRLDELANLFPTIANAATGPKPFHKLRAAVDSRRLISVQWCHSPVRNLRTASMNPEKRHRRSFPWRLQPKHSKPSLADIYLRPMLCRKPARPAVAGCVDET
jgi:hypothetical protein